MMSKGRLVAQFAVALITLAATTAGFALTVADSDVLALAIVLIGGSLSIWLAWKATKGILETRRDEGGAE